ncbi:MAG: hypothetical protein WEB03_09285 [Nitriliruptor sp.]|uniref:hypothetical protein n=1 Tax=Nitriliruptor sp. TaxID=2448056 RepID=UPI0034A0276A
MTIGPLRRTIGVVGLIALAPLAWLLATGAVSPVDAATRAVLTVVALTLIGRIAGMGVDRMAASLERSVVPAGPVTHRSPDATRGTDAPDARSGAAAASTTESATTG